jgi:transcriptional regulator with XRE-family HTH domain
MDTIERIKTLCKKSGITISQIEKKYGYGNGSLAKTKDITSSRLYQISKYFGVSMEYLMTGETGSDTSLTFEEKCILDAYRSQADGIKDAVCKLLDVKRDSLLYKEA